MGVCFQGKVLNGMAVPAVSQGQGCRKWPIIPAELKLEIGVIRLTGFAWKFFGGMACGLAEERALPGPDE